MNLCWNLVDPNLSIPDVLGHSVGLERYELLRELEGDDVSDGEMVRCK